MQNVLSNGSIEDIIEFIKSKNILNEKIFRFDQVYWLLKNKAFYDNLIQICVDKGYYENIVWSFSMYHGDYQKIKQFLESKEQEDHFSDLYYHHSDLLQLNKFYIREYYPLINPRAHVLASSSTNIINDTFKQMYNEFLTYLFFKFTPDTDDLVLFIGYLIAQDQIEKALELTKRITPESISSITTKVQFDYQTAYLNFITGYPDFDRAKKICEKYLTYPVLSVRNLFVEMANQLSEFEENDLAVDSQAKQEGELLNKQKSSKVASFSASLEGTKLKIVSCFVGELSVKFYKVEVEAIFSLDPFNFESKKSFSYVAPFTNQTIKVNDASELSVTFFEIPDQIKQENLFIEVRPTSEEIHKSEFLTYIPFKLNCVVSKEFGILKCYDPVSKKSVPKVYVKCFAKYHDGKTRFYKDGYTDLRGSFDYVSLNSDKIDNIESFAILVTAPEYGSKIFKENPPQKIGATEGEAKKLISKQWEHKREENIQQGKKQMTKSKNAYAYIC